MRKILVNVPFLASVLSIIGVVYYVIPAFGGIRELDLRLWWMLVCLNLVVFVAIAIVALFVRREFQRPLTMTMLIALICMYQLAWTGSLPMNESTLARIIPDRMGSAGEMWLSASLESLKWTLLGACAYWVSFGVIRYWMNRSSNEFGNASSQK